MAQSLNSQEERSIAPSHSRFAIQRSKEMCGINRDVAEELPILFKPPTTRIPSVSTQLLTKGQLSSGECLSTIILVSILLNG